MRRVVAVLSLLMLVVLWVRPILAADAPSVALADVSHAVDETTLVVTGWVMNRGPIPVSRLVIDVTGFSPSGDLVASGSDGIPWVVAPGHAERFSVVVPVPDALIRDYTLTVLSAWDPLRPLASVRRSVDIALYRPLVLSRIRVFGDVDFGQLTLRNDVRGLPVAQVTVEATVILTEPKINLLQTLTVTLPADTIEMFAVGGRRTFLVSLRIVDVLLATAWN